ncbi:MAG: RNA polymerase II transcription factor B 52 kDa subunit [Trizodia sp. TS-e1964]|nr:MAG: RNA polymerase II transcription factor B 52 kDa subunit [Trizodia sp. TS-e1964]
MSVSSVRSFEYLESLPGTVFTRLYQQPSTALAIFRRMLPHLAKSFVMAMLYMSDPLAKSDLDLWVRSDSRREKDAALSLLDRLHITAKANKPGQPATLVLSSHFAHSLRLALTGGGNHKSFGVPSSTPDKNHVDIAFLDSYARSQWEGILHFMVGSTGMDQGVATEGPSHAVKKLLEIGGLVILAGRRAEITKAGFSFLLQEANAQVWTLMIYYLKNAEDLHMDPVEVLSFLFMLGSLELGQDYIYDALTVTQKEMLGDLRDFGIVYQRKPQSRRFYPTRLATTLTSDAGALRSVSAGFDNALRSSDGKGFIVIETNYRIYAYTSSPLQIAVLALFTHLSTRYPNMVCGRVTRKSIRRAISMGITSDQIITYLTAHAHPQMRKSIPILPPTVADQIRLWQLEGERMKTTVGFLFKEFANLQDYLEPCKYAEECGVLVWKSDARRMFFATRSEQVAAFLAARKLEKAAA